MVEETPLEGMTPDEIEALLIDGISKGDMEFAGVQDGEIAISITPQGEQRVIGLLGGMDVADASHKLYNLLVKHGALGFSVEPDISNFTIIAQLMSMFKHYQTWDNLLLATKGDKEDKDD